MDTEMDEEDNYNYGSCCKCRRSIIGEGTGCRAFDQLFHYQCFTCHVCGKELRDKMFYEMDDHPYCEDDYLKVVEKCSVCNEPILGDRILYVNGKAHHPGCFKCIVCGKRLDHKPFALDAKDRIHCPDDKHK